jgi:hypothetical protein
MILPEGVTSPMLVLVAPMSIPILIVSLMFHIPALEVREYSGSIPQ